MWQRKNGKYHRLLNNAERMEDGRTALTACGKTITVRHENMQAYVMYGGDRCVVCDGVERLVFTSVNDARMNLRVIHDEEILKRCVELTSSVSLKKMLERKLRLIDAKRNTRRSYRVKLASGTTCMRCHEELPAGMYVYALKDVEFIVGHRHYGACPKLKRKPQVIVCSQGYDMREGAGDAS